MAQKRGRDTERYNNTRESRNGGARKSKIVTLSAIS
jgi:hypothetical protein